MGFAGNHDCPINTKTLYAPLPYKKTRVKLAWKKRVLFFDPADVYKRIEINTFKRIQTKLEMGKIFPKSNIDICACGCGQKLSFRRKRWATDDCARFATAVWEIIDGRQRPIASLLYHYYGKTCNSCFSKSALRLDHIVPVKHGGGGCWFSNYQFLCHACHVKKTNLDFGWKIK